MKNFAIPFFALVTSGCGTYVPNIADLPLNASGNLELISNVVASIRCELSQSVRKIIKEDLENSGGKNDLRTALWIESWAVNITLSLTVTENTNLNPSAVYLPPTAFSLSGGLSGSSKATVSITPSYKFELSKLNNTYDPDCKKRSITKHHRGSFLIKSDLRIYEYLNAYVYSVRTGNISKTPGGEAFKYQVKFNVDTGGNLSPTWTLRRGTINQGTTLFSANRAREHDLVAVFGPSDGKGNLIGSAADVYSAALISGNLN